MAKVTGKELAAFKRLRKDKGGLKLSANDNWNKAQYGITWALYGAMKLHLQKTHVDPNAMTCFDDFKWLSAVKLANFDDMVMPS